METGGRRSKLRFVIHDRPTSAVRSAVEGVVPMEIRFRHLTRCEVSGSDPPGQAWGSKKTSRGHRLAPVLAQ